VVVHGLLDESDGQLVEQVGHFLFLLPVCDILLLFVDAFEESDHLLLEVLDLVEDHLV